MNEIINYTTGQSTSQGNKIFPLKKQFHTTPLEAYIPAVTKKTRENPPVTSKMYPVSKLAQMPAATPSVLVMPRCSGTSCVGKQTVKPRPRDYCASRIHAVRGSDHSQVFT
jgi:hypothetical protein